MLPASKLLQDLVPPPCSHLVILSLHDVATTRDDLLALGNLQSLAVLAIAGNPRTSEGLVDDNVIRLWSRQADPSLCAPPTANEQLDTQMLTLGDASSQEDTPGGSSGSLATFNSAYPSCTRGFASLRLLMVAWQSGVTERSLSYIDAFPQLQIFTVIEAESCTGTFQETKALQSGWDFHDRVELNNLGLVIYTADWDQMLEKLYSMIVPGFDQVDEASKKPHLHLTAGDREPTKRAFFGPSADDIMMSPSSGFWVREAPGDRGSKRGIRALGTCDRSTKKKFRMKKSLRTDMSDTFMDLMHNSRISDWYEQMMKAVGDSSRLSAS